MRTLNALALAAATFLAGAAHADPSKPFNPFLRAGQSVSEAPHSLSGPGPVVEVKTYEDSFEDSLEVTADQSPSRVTVHDLVEPIPERGPSYRPRPAERPSAAASTSPSTHSSGAVTSAVPPRAAITTIPLPPPEDQSLLTSAAPAPALVGAVPELQMSGLPPPVFTQTSTSAPLPLKGLAVPAPALTEEVLETERAERFSNCERVRFLGKQLTIIPPTSTAFKLPFKGLKGCLSAMGAKEPWIELVDSRGEDIELFANENLTDQNRRAVVMVVTPSETIEVRVMQRKYDLLEKKPHLGSDSSGK